MIGFLRFAGMLNAAIWLGAVIFCVLGVSPVANSQGMLDLVGPQYFGYLSGGSLRMVFGRLYTWQIVFALLAWVHVTAEWLYLGRIPRRRWVVLLTLLFSLSLAGALWINPKLTNLHRTQHAVNVSPATKEVARQSFKVWEGVFQVVNLFMIAGVLAHLWRVTSVADAPRFMSPSKFRS